jgi:hypothetical protein
MLTGLSKIIETRAEEFAVSQDKIRDELVLLNKRIYAQISMMDKREKREELIEKERKTESERTNKAVARAAAATAGSSSPEGSFSKSFGSVAGKGLGAGVGLAGLGVGIAGFMSAIAAGGKITEWINTDMTALKKVMVGVAEAFDEMPTGGFLKLGAVLAAGGVAGALFGVGGAVGGTAGMVGVGVGIAGFLTAMAGMSAAAQKFGADGSTIRDIMVNVAQGLGAFSGDSLKTLGALLVPGALFGAALGVTASVGGGAIAAGAGIGVPVGLTLIGAGLAGFLGAFAGVGALAGVLGIKGEGIRDIMVNIGAGLAAMPLTDADSLVKVASSLAPLAEGMSMLFAEEGLGAIRQINEAVLDLMFGTGDRDSIFEKLAEQLTIIGSMPPEVIRNLTPLSAAVRDLGLGLTDISNVDMGDFNKNISAFGESMAETIPMLSDIYNGTGGEERTYEIPGMMNDVTANFGDGLKSVPMEMINTKLNQFPLTDAVNQGTMDAVTASGTTIVNNITNAPSSVNTQNNVASTPSVTMSPVTENSSRYDAWA